MTLNQRWLSWNMRNMLRCAQHNGGRYVIFPSDIPTARNLERRGFLRLVDNVIVLTPAGADFAENTPIFGPKGT